MYSEKCPPSGDDNSLPSSSSSNSVVYTLFPGLAGQTPSATLGIHTEMGSSHHAEGSQLTSALIFPSPAFDPTSTTSSLITLVTPKKLAAAALLRTRPSRFPCPLCSQKFTTQRNLENHHNSHFGIKVHYCDRCGEAFSTKSSRVRHQKKCM